MMGIVTEDRVKIDFSKEKNIIVFGSGTIAASCIKYLRDNFSGNIWIYENRQNNISILEKQIKSLNAVKYECLDGDIVSKVNCIQANIIFSINNTYIFPEELIRSHIIINYHNALLPLHPGRFAEAWAIYNRDLQTGVTFHLVTNEVDKGKIMLQEAIKLDESYTSIKLLMLQTKSALGLFKHIIDGFNCDGEMPLYDQRKVEDDCKMHYSFEKPNDGVLDYTKPSSVISAFLRAMDYGVLKMLGKPTVVYNGRNFSWGKYSIVKGENMEEKIDIVGNDMFIFKGDCTIVLNNLVIIDD